MLDVSKVSFLLFGAGLLLGFTGNVKGDPCYETLVTTCQFEGHNLVTIAETVDKLMVQLSTLDNDAGNDSKVITKEEITLKSVQTLKETYRGLVNGFAKVGLEENPLPVLHRLKRNILETIDQVDEPLPTEAPFSSSKANSTEPEDVMLLPLNYKWRRMVTVCWDHYRLLKHIIYFEGMLRRMEDDFEEDEYEEMEHEGKATWMKAAICKLNGKVTVLGKMIQSGANHVIANKLIMVGLILISFFLLLVAFGPRTKESSSPKTGKMGI